MKPGVPELYLYSSADELTDCARLQHLIATRQDRCLCLSGQSRLVACQGSMYSASATGTTLDSLDVHADCHGGEAACLPAACHT